LSSSGRELLAGVHVDPGDAEAIDELMRLADEARESALAAGAIDDGDSLFTRRSRRLATPQRRFLTTCATEIDIRVGTTKLRAGTTSGRAARGGPYGLCAGEHHEAGLLALFLRGLQQLTARAGVRPLNANASSTRVLRSETQPDRLRILSATLFVASNTAWKYFCTKLFATELEQIRMIVSLCSFERSSPARSSASESVVAPFVVATRPSSRSVSPAKLRRTLS